MDPEQTYQEVLQEEQQKGSSAPVAEGRAKAARQRAVEGSPHPKEARWWPGAQPRWEGGGDGAAPAAEAAPPMAEEPSGTEPAALEPATTGTGTTAATEEVQNAPVAIDQAPAGAPPPAAPEQPPASQPAQVPAAAGAPAQAAAATAATPTELPPDQRPAGVTHGTTTGTRLRPEDGVSTDAQFDGQKAMQERRRLIDELVATGVPSVTAAEAGRPRAPLLLLAYLIIPLVAIGILAGSRPSGGDAIAPAGERQGPNAEDGGGPTTQVSAEANAFDTETITLAAGEQTSIEFDNQDAGTQHNIAIYEEQGAEEAIFDGEFVAGPESITYEFKAPPEGEYYFQCDVHPDMNGTVVSQ